MPNARENLSLTQIEHDIAGNVIRAYYDKDDKLIFVLDETVNADKPNVLLVIDSFDGRKWDEVLVNDYNVDLETVRPKRDNKYQKLDIEYGGLDVYADLISADENGDDLDDALDNLNRFRIMSVRRSARERLDAANEVIEKAQDTIKRTNDTIDELRTKIKDLRGRVAAQRREIGREPTKASAAKILKTEAQIDATNEKLTRAKKRLTNAQRRLTTAEEDAEIARALLARDVPKVSSKPKNKIVRQQAPVVVEKIEPKAEEMRDDEEIKPLFDRDPENLDDSIAFKPIDFGNDAQETQEPVSKPVEQSFETTNESNHDNDDFVPAPLSFTPPTKTEDENVLGETETPTESDLPVLETLTPEPIADIPELPTETSYENDSKPIMPEPLPEPILESQKQITEDKQAKEPLTADAPVAVTPVVPVVPVAPVTPVRPVSPVMNNVTPVDEKPHKATFMYYVLLVLLILLSIGTLWLYQKTTSENTPDLAMVVSEKAPTPAPEKPSIVAEPIVQTVSTTPGGDIKEEPVAEPIVSKPIIVEPKPVVTKPSVVDVEPEPVAVDVAPVIESVAIEPEPVVVKPEPAPIEMESSFVMPKPVATYEPEKPRIPTEAEVLATKPGYNVSQNEKMFVAESDYDTDVAYANGETDDYDEYVDVDVDIEPVVVKEPITIKEPAIVVAEPEPAEYNQVASVVFDDEPATTSVCEGGAATDSYGCCPGEEYTYTDDGFMCCNGDDCFPPVED